MKIFKILNKALRILKTQGTSGFWKKILSKMPNPNYQRWIKYYDTLTHEDRIIIRNNINSFPYKPLISVIMPTYNTPEKWLRLAIESVVNQLYPNWELCIADDASTLPHVKKIIEEYEARDARIKVLFREKNGHISAASNSAVEIATGEFIALLDHDDELPPHALYWVAKIICEHPDAALIYTDEDKLVWGRRSDPYFKPDWNPDLFLSHNMVSHLGVYRTSLVWEVGCFREGFEGAQDYDLALRCVERLRPEEIFHIPRILYHWRVSSGSTSLWEDEKPYAMIAGELRYLACGFKKKYLEEERLQFIASNTWSNRVNRIEEVLSE